MELDECIERIKECKTRSLFYNSGYGDSVTVDGDGPQRASALALPDVSVIE